LQSRPMVRKEFLMVSDRSLADSHLLYCLSNNVRVNDRRLLSQSAMSLHSFRILPSPLLNRCIRLIV
jgi:hypothetical protein